MRCALFCCALLCFFMFACQLELVQKSKRIIGEVSIGIISNGTRTGEWLDKNSLLKAHVEGIATGGLGVGSLLESEISCSEPAFEAEAICQWVRSKGSDADGEYAMINGATEADRDRFIKLLVYHPDYSGNGESNIIGPVGAQGICCIFVTLENSTVDIGQKTQITAFTTSGESVVWTINGPSDRVVLTDENANPVEVDAIKATNADRCEWTVTAALVSNPAISAKATVTVGGTEQTEGNVSLDRDDFDDGASWIVDVDGGDIYMTIPSKNSKTIDVDSSLVYTEIQWLYRDVELPVLSGTYPDGSSFTFDRDVYGTNTGQQNITIKVKIPDSENPSIEKWWSARVIFTVW